EAAEQYPDKKALHFMGKEMTYREVYEAALKFAGYLKKLGVEKGDRVAVLLPNSPQAVIGFYGILYTGGIAVMANPLYTERELEYQLKDSGAKAI
ncbi:AMP-binding protein, partial [Anaerostipes hadrus]